MTLSKENNIARLVELLTAQTTMLRDELEPLLKRKQRALVANELDELETLAEEEQAVASRLAELEAERVIAVGTLAGQYGINVDDAATLALDDLLELIPERDVRLTIVEHAKALKHALCDLAWANDDNRHLTQNLLDYTAMVVRLVTQGETRPSYNSTGNVATGTAERAMLDDRI